MDGCRRIVPLALALVVAACGSGALSGPAGTTVEPATTTTTTGTSEATPEPVRTTTALPQKKATTTTTAKRQYGWNLPEGPSSPATYENEIYTYLRYKDCGLAQQVLDDLWNGLKSPRNVPLYQAAVDLCGGKTTSARSMYARAAALGLQMHQGPGGTAAVDCATLRAVRSVVDQVAQESVRCAPGTPPPWPTDEPIERDDPRTDVVEGITTTTAPSST